MSNSSFLLYNEKNISVFYYERGDPVKTIQTYIKKENEINLKKSYMEAYQQEEFKKLVDSLDISESLLIQYTSLLEEAAKEKENCLHCKSLTSCKNKVPGYLYTPQQQKNRIAFSYEMCPKKKKQEELYAYQKNIEYFHIPKQIALASFKDFYKDSKARVPILKYFEFFMTSYLKEKKGKGLYLCGSFGSGKTYMIAALFNELAKKGVQSCMVYYPELLRLLKSSFKDSYEEKFDRVRKAPLLLLDDIGAENVTSWSRDEVLGPILQYRMEEELPTFFTSNFTMEELEKLLGQTTSAIEKVKAKRILERIKQVSEEYVLNSKNRREE